MCHDSSGETCLFAICISEPTKSSPSEFANPKSLDSSAATPTSSPKTASGRLLPTRLSRRSSPYCLERRQARYLTEGVDVPEIDCILFADPKTSKVDIVQACGRALRRSEGKQFGHIIVPCVVADGASVEQIRQSVAFMFVLDVICALAAQDERIIEEFRAVSQGKRYSSRPIISFNLNEVVAQNINTEEFTRAIELECWNKLARLAWRLFVDARECARSLGLRDVEQWKRWARHGMSGKPKCPVDIPASPDHVFSNEWQGWRDLLGTELLSFEEARAFARTLGLS